PRAAALPGQRGRPRGARARATGEGARCMTVLHETTARGILRVPLVNRLSLLVDLASLLAREVDLDALLGSACERVAQALSAERATIWLTDAETGELVTRVAVRLEVPELHQPLDRGLAGWVARTGETARV